MPDDAIKIIPLFISRSTKPAKLNNSYIAELNKLHDEKCLKDDQSEFNYVVSLLKVVKEELEMYFVQYEIRRANTTSFISNCKSFNTNQMKELLLIATLPYRFFKSSEVDVLLFSGKPMTPNEIDTTIKSWNAQTLN